MPFFQQVNMILIVKDFLVQEDIDPKETRKKTTG